LSIIKDYINGIFLIWYFGTIISYIIITIIFIKNKTILERSGRKMAKINLRTKVEVIITIFFLIIPSVVAVTSMTRTISDTHDDIERFIRNSNGNLWEATGSNIQTAIDDLGITFGVEQFGGTHGTVWLPGNMTITTSSTIYIKDYVTLDMNGCCLQPNGNFEAINLSVGSEIKNGIINVSGITNYNKACIGLNSHRPIGFRCHPPKIIDMTLISDNTRGIGIYLHTWGTTYKQNINNLIVNNVKINNFSYGIYIHHTYSSAESYINGNMFSNIIMYGCETFIKVSEVGPEASGNYFYNIHCHCTSDTECIIWNNGIGNVYDTIIVYNWNNNSGTRTSYNFSVDSPGSAHHAAHQCYLSFIGGGDDIAIGPWARYTPGNCYTILNLEDSELTIGTVNEESP
jgi:hypothetical protein